MNATKDHSTADDTSLTEKVSYIDYSRVPDDMNAGARPRSGESDSCDSMRKRGPSQAFVFPTKLYEILASSEFSHIVTWLPHGRSWRVLDRQAFLDQIMPNYFSQTKYQSFIRQVNGWGFRRITQGQDQDSYYHCFFLRTKKHLTKFMTRHHVAKQRSNPEPNLYSYPFLPLTTPSHNQDPTTQPDENSGTSYCCSQQGLITHKTTSSYDGYNNVLMPCSLAIPSTNVMIRNSSRAHPNHSSIMRAQSYSKSSYQESYDCWRHDLQSQYNWDERSHSRIENRRQSSNFVFSSGAGFSSSANSLAAGHDYLQESASFYSPDGRLYCGYGSEAVFPSRASSDGQRIPHQRSSSQGCQQMTALMDSGENNGCHEDTRAKGEKISAQNTYHLAQQRGAKCEVQDQYGRQCEQQPSQISSGELTGSQKEEHELTNQPILPYHTGSGPSNRPSAPPDDCWDPELAATLLCQLEEDNGQH